MPHERCRVTSASPMPRALSTPASGWIEHLPNAQLARDGTRMLRRRPSERDEHIVGRIGPFGDGHQPNRRRHIRIRNPQQPRRQLLQRIRFAIRDGLATSVASCPQPHLRRRPIERKRKPLRDNPPQETNSNPSRSAARRGRSTPAPDRHPHSPARRRASRRRTGKSIRRRPRPFRSPSSAPRAARRPFAFRIPARIGRRSATHRCSCRPCRSRSPARSRPPAPRARTQPRRPPARKECCPCRRNSQPRQGRRPRSAAAIWLPGSAVSQPLDILAQHRIQIRIDDRRIGPRDEFRQRRDGMRHADLAKADFARNAGDELLVLRMPIGMQQANRQRFDAGVVQRLKLLSNARLRSVPPSTCPSCVTRSSISTTAARQRRRLADVRSNNRGRA